MKTYPLIEPVILTERTTTDRKISNLIGLLELAEYQNKLDLNKVNDLLTAGEIINKSINQN